ncbi:Arm DNA-binding domain-containing protein [Pseudomonas viridiflava]|uniref:Arm DNA-binding domain-containing protein n=1 Tax=Pseudomonas viridiflava TaxID=33069 RepID=UPI0030B966F0
MVNSASQARMPREDPVISTADTISIRVMGRDGRGVRAVSDTSIEITFMYRGIRCRERITLKPSLIKQPVTY